MREKEDDDVASINVNVSIGLDALDRPIWGARGIAEAIGADERKVWHLIRIGAIPVGRAGDRVFTTARALKATFRVEA
jgi:hypothetical protein